MRLIAKPQVLKYGQQEGSILLEALIAIVVMAAGLLGLASLQARVMNSGSSAYYRSIASDIAADLADRIAANSSPYSSVPNTTVPGITSAPDYSAIGCKGPTVLPGGANSTATTFSCGATTDTGPAAMADSDLVAYYQAIQQLPGGQGSIAIGGAGYTVTITWTDYTQARSGDTKGSTTTFTTNIAKPS